jgi:hypothetical protein
LACHLQLVADLDPAYHFDADADPDSAYHFDAEPNPDPAYLFYADPGPDPNFQSDLDPDPLHCIFYSLQKWLSFLRFETLRCQQLPRVIKFMDPDRGVSQLRVYFLTLGLEQDCSIVFQAEIRDCLHTDKQNSVCIVTKGADV